ncbi:MAG: restriction endonuclease [Fimbriimonadaceae bacterium]|nr:restriction endonuclease [Alphaproteobacteria bacterium]
MANELPKVLWGIHMPKEIGTQPIDEGFVSLGWSEVGNILEIESDREAFKECLSKAYPDAKPGAIPVWAGILYRFAHVIQIGDGIIYPSKSDRTINFGIIDGPCTYEPNSKYEETRQRRKVRWIAHLPRASFSQSALHAIGSIITLFQVANNADEFLAAFSGDLPEVAALDEEGVETVSEQVAENSDDYVLKRLKSVINDEEFEHFVARLLEAMGYFARVTKKSGDGGVDVIAHRDELGFEPPLIKVQCKQTFSTIGRPDVQKLDGAVGVGEFGMFVTLGGFSSDAVTYEQMKPNLRLIDGPALAELVYRHYSNFSSATQRIVPLRRIYVPGPTAKD